jgi:hypothetical protein
MSPVYAVPWHFTTWLDLLDHWQTLAAAFLAVAAAVGTIWATTRSATQQIASTQKQIETSLCLDQRRVGREALAFHTMLEAAVGHVLDEAKDVEETFPGPTPYLYEKAYAARKRFSKRAFNEVRGACVMCGGGLTVKFLELENEIDKFASLTREATGMPGRSDDGPWGEPNGLISHLHAINEKAKDLRDAAAAEMDKALLLIAQTELEPQV